VGGNCTKVDWQKANLTRSCTGMFENLLGVPKFEMNLFLRCKKKIFERVDRLTSHSQDNKMVNEVASVESR
jgi:hypothetical protein